MADGFPSLDELAARGGPALSLDDLEAKASDKSNFDTSAFKGGDKSLAAPRLEAVRATPADPGESATPQERLKFKLARDRSNQSAKRIATAAEKDQAESQADNVAEREARRSAPIEADSELERSGVKFWQRIRALGAGGGRLAESALTSVGIDPNGDAAQWLRAKSASGEDYSQRPVEGEQTWAALKKAPTVAGLTRFVLENGASSLADMGALASGIGVGAYVGMQSGSIGQQRAENNADITADATGADVLKALPAATASALLERIGMHGIFGAGARTVVGRIAQAFGTEAITEAIQSPIEYAGSNLGTKAGFDVREAADQALSGAVAGGFMGGAIRSGIEAGGAAFRPRVTPPGTDVAAGGPAGPAPDLGSPADFYADPRTGQTRTFSTAREAGLYATSNKMADQVNVMDAGNGSFVLKKTAPMAAVSDDEVLTPGDRASPIPDSVIAAGRRAQAATIDPDTARAKVDAFIADPSGTAPSPEEAIAALNARRAAPIGQPQVDTIAQPTAAPAPRASGGVADFVARTGGAESGGDPNATNSKSSATGTHQFIDKTWLGLMRQNRARETSGMSDEQVLALRKNPLISAQMAAVYARQNGEALRRNGHQVDNGTLYLSHFLGAGGANAVLSADPNTPVAQVLQPGQIRANKSVLEGKTASQVVAWAYKKMGENAAARPAGTPTPVDPASPEAAQQESESVDQFITRVLGDGETGGDVTLEEAPDSGEVLPAAVTTAETPAADTVRGEEIDKEWTRFAPESGTLNVPRDQMPQVKAENRGAMVNFLAARGIAHQEETIPATSLKPTQAEFSEPKVTKAKEYEGGNRAILVSSDNHVLDGHHQWLAARDAGADIRVIRLDAPVQQLLAAVHEMPSVETADGKQITAPRRTFGAENGGDQTTSAIQSRDDKAPRTQRNPGISNLERDTATLPVSDSSGVSSVRGRGDNDLLGVGDRPSGIRGVSRPAPDAGSFGGPDQVGEGVRTGQRPVGDARDTEQQQAPVAPSSRERQGSDGGAVVARDGDPRSNNSGENEQGPVAREGAGGKEATRREAAPNADARRQDDGTLPVGRGSRDSSTVSEGAPSQGVERGARTDGSGSRVTVDDMPSGKSVIVRGASPEQMAAIMAALPDKVQPLENAKMGGTVFSAKYRDRINGALDVPAAAAQAPAPAATTPRGTAVPQRATDKKNPNIYVRNGERYTFSEQIGYLGGGQQSEDTYIVENATKSGAYFRNVAAGGGSSLQNYEMQAALRKGAMQVVEAPAAPVEDDVPPEMRAPKPKPTAAEPAAEKPRASPNRIVSDERAAELRDRLKKKLRDLGSQLNSIGIDPEMIAIGTELGVYHIEKGARRFTAFSKAIAADLGVKVTDLRKFLRGWYNGSRDMLEDMGESVVGMDGPEEVAGAMRRIESWADEEADVPAARETTPAPAPAPAPAPSPTPTPAPTPAASGDLATRLRTAFVGEFTAGRSFATITEARKFAAEQTGDTFAAGTAPAKALDEAIETAVVQAARAAVIDGERDATRTYGRLVELYAQQPKLTVRTSTSIEQQAYSTPVPLAYVASRLAGIDQNTTVYEPSAGNGALLIDANPSKVRANELNADRVAALRSLYPDATVTDRDATEYAPSRMDAVIANPPFGPIKDDAGNTVTFAVDGPYRTNEIDHAIAWQALKAMKDDGRAVLIVGSVAKTAHSNEARSDAYNGKAKREFYLKLYRAYNVTDHFTVAGELYERQGAGWPVDVVVINGRGTSTRALPAADVPRMYDSWDALGEVLTNDGREQATPAIRQPDRSGAVEGRRPSRTDVGDTDAGRGSRIDRRDGIGADEQPDVVRDGSADGQPDGARMGASEAGRTEAVADQGSERPAGRNQPAVNPEVVENDRQVAYTPGSRAPAMGTLVPINMQTAVNDALAALRERVGDTDEFVANRLGYSDAELAARFGGEQVDAIALAVDNIERGAGFIIGDQTGIGKGRVVAAVIRYAMRQNRAPIFVTEKPNLYKDMYRDMADIGVPEMLGRDLNILMSDSAKTVPLDDEGTRNLRSPGAAAHNASLERVARDGLKASGFDVLFTTYSQMQSIGGEETARQRAIRALASGGVLILDESHNAGGQGPQRGAKKAEDGKPVAPSRAEFVRELVGLAHGVFYSSATYAKRPDVMDLYAATDMRLAVDDMSKLGEAIAKGGVPMQQIVASMLARSGQYLRRERSFDGIAYNTPQVAVDRGQYEAASSILKAIQLFSEDHVGPAAAGISDELKAEAETVSADNSTGGAGASSTNFTAIMHNVIDQMLLAFKAEAGADRAIEAIKRGEKPVLTVANTLESLLTGYVEEEGVKIGQSLDLTFADVFRRYLERSRWISIRKPFMEKGEKAERKRLSDADLGPAGARAFREAMALIDSSGLESLPGSPLDAMIGRIKDAGYKVAEITGRTLGINYRDGKAYLMSRGAADKSIAGRIKSITDFNDGSVDVMVLNQSGATGLSLHASSKFKDQRKRRMIIAQAEKNIDTHMQMLGRVHRTGQVVLPEYDQLVAAIPAEKRPASVLAKKMASLNANTTGARDSAVTAKDVPDFMNVYGDEVAARVMMEEPDIHDALGRPLTEEEEGYAKDGAMRKVTGRIPLLPVSQQEEIYDRLENEYTELLANKEAAGENALEAKTLDLDARTEEVTEAVPAKTASSSPFAAPVNVERVQVKRLGKPYATSVVREMVSEGKSNAPDTTAAKNNGDAFMRVQIAAATDATTANLRKRLTENMESFTKLAALVKVGEGVRLKTDNGNLYGVITSLEQTGRPKNPVALGSWKATIALVDASRQITIPFSQLSPDTGGASVPGRIMIERVTKIGDFPILDGFDQMQTDSRETRSILTGNILAGFDFIGSRGAIINFTDSEGGVRQGIMAPRGWSLEKQQKVNGVPLTDARAIVDFLSTSTSGLIGKGRTGDVVVQLFPQRGDLIVSASKSKKAGGEFFLNRDLTTALRTDFVSNSSGMVARSRAEVAGPVVQVLLKDGVRFEIPGNAPEDTKQRARDLMAQYGGARFSRVTPPAQGGFDLSAPQPERSMTAAQRGELEARQQQGMARRGEQQGLGDQEGGLFSSERDQASLFSRAREPGAPRVNPEWEATRKEIAANLDKLGLSDKVALKVVDRIFNDPIYAGMYDRGMITIAMDAAATPAGTLDHEAIHALRDLGAFLPAEWTALKKAAEADAELMKSIRDRYGDRGLDEEGIVEEAIADMFGEWSAGRRQDRGFIRSAFQRIADIISAIRRLVGMARGADVMRQVESGAIGRRDSQAYGERGPRWSIPGPGPNSTEPNGGVLAGLRRGIDSLIGNGEGMSERVDEWRTRLQDRMLPLLRTQQRIELESGVALPEGLNPYLSEELMSGKVGARLEKLQDDHVAPLFDAMKAEKVDKEELETFLYARHAPERNERISEINSKFEEGTGSGMSDAEASSIMERVDAEGKRDALERLAARVDALLAFAVETRVEAGLLAREEAEAWATTYRHYVPLRGEAEIQPEDGSATRPRSGSGINIRGAESKRAFGRKSRADNILAYSLLQAEEAIVRAGTNEVAQSFYALARANPDPDFWTINKVTRKPAFNKKSGQVTYRSDSQISAEDAPFTVSLKIDGQERRVTMNRKNPAAVKLAEVMRKMDASSYQAIVQYLGSYTRFFSAINTRYNPVFFLKNIIRDLQTGLVILQKYEDKPGLARGVLADWRKAITAKRTGDSEWAKWRQEFEASGGKIYFNQMNDIGKLASRIDINMKGRNGFRTATKAFFDAVETVNDQAENALRLSVFKNARERGASPSEAASMARNVTVNFTRRGSLGPLINAAYAFFNASVQGTANLMGAAKSKRVRRALYGIAAAGLLMDLLNAFVSDDDDDGQSFWSKIPEYDKRTNLIVMIPGGRDKTIKIPIGLGLNAFYNVGRTVSEAMRGARTPASAAGESLTGLAGMFNPLGSGGSFLNLIAPTFLDPAVDITVNKTFTGAPIQPENSPFAPPKAPSSNYFPSVNPVARGATDALNAATGGDEVVPGAVSISPEVAEYLFGYVTGGAGRFAGDLLKLGAAPISDTDVSVSDVPFVSTFVGSRPQWLDKSLYYTRIDEIDLAASRLKQYRADDQDEAGDGFEDKNATLLDLKSKASAARKDMKAARRDRLDAQASYDKGEMTRSAFNAEKKSLDEQEHQIVTDFNRSWYDALKR